MTEKDVMTRSEHLAWAKARALEYLARGDVKEALTSMISDLNKHSATRRMASECGPLAVLLIVYHSPRLARRFIEGFQ
jgi:hypothetical protein